MPLEDVFELNERQMFKIVIYILKDFFIKGANSTHWHWSLPVITCALVLLIICETASWRMDCPKHKLLYIFFFSFEEIGKIFQVYEYTTFRFILTRMYWYLLGKEILETKNGSKYPIYKGTSLSYSFSQKWDSVFPSSIMK